MMRPPRSTRGRSSYAEFLGTGRCATDRIRRIGIGALACAAVLTGCGGSAGAGRSASFGDPQGAFPTMTSALRLGTARAGHLTITDARVVLGATTATVLFTATSSDGRADTFVRATSSAGTPVTTPGGPIVVPANGSVTLRADGPRIVVATPVERPPNDATVEVTMTFAVAGAVDVFAPVALR